MKTERITLLTTPEFKMFLASEAKRGGVSVAELVRSRFENARDPDEDLLIALTMELKTTIEEARASLLAGLADVDAALKSRVSAGKQRARRPKKPVAPIAA